MEASGVRVGVVAVHGLGGADERVAAQRLGAQCLRRIEAAPAGAGGIAIRERLDGHRPETRIGDAVASGRNEEPRREHRVQRRRVLAVRFRIFILLEQVQGTHQLRTAGDRGRARVQRVSAIVARHRLAFGGEVPCEVAELHRAALAA